MEKATLLPPHLKAGDTIGITSISGPVDLEKLKKGTSVLEEMGFRTKLSENIRTTHGYHAGTDEERAAGLNGFLNDPEVRAVIFARGGCGAFRMTSFSTRSWKSATNW